MYKFLEIDRMDIVIVHLNSLVLKQAESLSVRERNILSDLLLYCYIYRIAVLDAKSSDKPINDIVKEFHTFLETCQAYDHQVAVQSLLRLGMIEDMFKVWKTSGCKVGSCIELLSKEEYMELSGPIVENLLPFLKKSDDFLEEQHVLFKSPFFSALSADEQVKIILNDHAFIKRNITTIVEAIPLLSEESLIELITVFDPEGQKFKNIDFLTSESTIPVQYLEVSYDQVPYGDKGYIAKVQDAIELFLQVLLCLCHRLKKKENNNLPEKKEEIKLEEPEKIEEEKIKNISLSKSNFQLKQNTEARRVSDVSCGCNHIAVITESGELFTWGSNHNGQLGLGSTAIANVATPTRVTELQGKKITLIACGGEYTIVCTIKMDVYSWGKGTSGQLGHGNKQTISSPKLIEAFADSEVEVAQLACGFHHTTLLTTDGSLWSFGEGLLGNGTNSAVALPILIEDIECGESSSS